MNQTKAVELFKVSHLKPLHIEYTFIRRHPPMKPGLPTLLLAGGRARRASVGVPIGGANTGEGEREKDICFQTPSVGFRHAPPFGDRQCFKRRRGPFHRQPVASFVPKFHRPPSFNPRSSRWASFATSPRSWWSSSRRGRPTVCRTASSKILYTAIFVKIIYPDAGQQLRSASRNCSATMPRYVRTNTTLPTNNCWQKAFCLGRSLKAP